MRRFTYILLLALIVVGSDGCSYLTKSGRQQAAYARYVRKMSKGRVKIQRKFASRPKFRPQPTDPVVTTSTGPESVTASSDSQQQ